jgi:cell division protein FtsQ
MRRLTAPSSAIPKRAAPGKGGNARRQARAWRRRLATAGMAAAVSAGMGLAIAVGMSDKPAILWHATKAEALAFTARAGLTVSDIQAVGRRQTGAEDILAALGVSSTTPILGLDLADAKRRVESLPWVAHAEIERRLPHTLRVVITERVPIAISQADDRSVLIDAKGTEIVAVTSRIADLPIVTGRGAAENYAALRADLAAAPDLAARVRAAVRVGDRRWNLKLDSVEDGIEVRLPETDAAAAWAQLAEIDRKHRLLARDVVLIDLRLPDRVVVRLPNGKTLPPPNLGPTRSKGGQSA